MDDLRELYTDTLMSFYLATDRKGELTGAQELEGKNLSCGDRIKLFLQVENGKIKDARFTGYGCVISQSSATIMCRMLLDKDLNEAEKLLDSFIEFMQGKDVPEEVLGDAIYFEGVRKFPSRVKCATLAWHTAKELIQKLKGDVKNGD
ncbi:MAG: nitrogen fixation protein NifU [Thermotogota bacterium]|nr:nitrogen fixation protein NifU [Thermotogota bacterium]